MILKEYSRTNRRLQIETLTEEMKSVVLEEYEFREPDEFIQQKILAFVVHQDSNAET